MLAFLLGCSSPSTDSGVPSESPWIYPTVDALPEVPDPPDPFALFFEDGTVGTPAQWEEKRRPELLALFDHYLYGLAAPSVASTVTSTPVEGWNGPGVARALDVGLEGGPTLHLVVFLPEGIDHPPVLLGLNKCGNQSVAADPALPATTAWQHPDCDPARGSRADEWPLAVALDAGFAVATLHESELDPDDDQADPGMGVQASFSGDSPPWATLSAWAWGLSAAADALEQDGTVDTGQMVVFGHSRRGKAALLAGARDPRFAGVWAHQSGTGGASLSRSLAGESIEAITVFFPHWFVPEFASFAGEETRLPIDQHLLLALSAPRRLLVSDGEDDLWADPDGAAEAVDRATPVWELYGAAAPTWTVRPGDHAIGEADWASMLAWWGG